ncbi:MAG: cyclic nucleotide-binding domain-containing protein [Hyphomicrobium sp.]
MAIDAFVKPLLALPLFRGLKPLQITEIARRADRIVYRAGESIVRENQAGDAAILIISGEAVRVSQDNGDAAERVLEGSMIGELAMLVETIYTSTVIAKTSVRALRFSRAEIHGAMHDDRSLAEHFSTQITARLKRLALELKSIDEALAEVTDFDPPPHATQIAAPLPQLFH